MEFEAATLSHYLSNHGLLFVLHSIAFNLFPMIKFLISAGGYSSTPVK
jgi:hypothetical protein